MLNIKHEELLSSEPEVHKHLDVILSRSPMPPSPARTTRSMAKPSSASSTTSAPCSTSPAPPSTTRPPAWLATQAVRKVDNKALTKIVWYPVVKKVAVMLGQKITRQTVGSAVTKVVPVLGDVVAGTLTYGPDPWKVDTSGVSYAAWVSVADVSASKSSGARRLHQECRLRVL